MVKIDSIVSSWRILSESERREALRVIVIVILAAVANAAMIASIWPFLSMIGNPEIIFEDKYYSLTYSYFGFKSVSSFIILSAVFSLVLIVFSTAIQVYRVYFVSRFALMKSHSLSYRLFEHYIGQSYEYHTIHNSSELEANLLSETQHVVQQLYRPAANMIASIASVIAMLVLLLVIDVKISLAVFGVFGSFYFLIIFGTKKAISSLGKKRHAENKKCYRVASESLGGIKEIKANALESFYRSKFYNSSKCMAESLVKAQVLGEAPNFMLQGITFAGMILFTIVLVDVSKISEVGLGETIPLLGVFAFAGQRLIPELQRIFQGYTQFQYANESAKNLYEVFMQGNSKFSKSEVDVGNTHLTNGSFSNIRFQSVTYRFPGSDKDAVCNLSFTIPAGVKIGIVGTTGSGKTTFVDLLLGLLSPTEGQILIDSTVLDLSNIRYWQSQCSYLPQEVFLFDGSIKDNISFGSSGEIDEVRLEQALYSSSLRKFIEQRKNGINAFVGERGVQLSGGQRQRIGLARALYKQSNVIILDEATSALDNETEKEVLDKLYSNTNEVTVFVIAHRLSSIRACDSILVMDDGCLVGQGSWDTLLAENEYFKRLVKVKSNEGMSSITKG